MKIKVTDITYEELLNKPVAVHQKPKKQNAFMRFLVSVLSGPELKATDFTYTGEGMEKLGEQQPCLILMNHSSFTDLQIIGKLFRNRPYHIVCTNDGFIGKAGLLKALGCIPTRKFIPELNLIRDMQYTLQELKESVVMYPEASYSFDGSETPLPKSLGKCLKILKVPVIMVKCDGAFLRDPLYNNLQKRDVRVSAKVTYLLSPEEIKEKSPDELNRILAEAFHYDHFRKQKEEKVLVKEGFRADGLHRVLYKCCNCGTEGSMIGKGITITCSHCGEIHELTEEGVLKRTTSGIGQKFSDRTAHTADDATDRTRFPYITDWYQWERECVRKEIEDQSYRLSFDVDILALVDEKSMYRIGDGVLTHTTEGFHLTGCDGKLDYVQSPKASYSLYADYFWYEIGDMVSIGNTEIQYYCFPKDNNESHQAIVAKARLAAEEMNR